MDILSEFIIAKFREDPGAFDGKLGSQIYARAVEGALKSIPEDTLSDMDPELREKFGFLKSCEIELDLGWMGFASWNTLSPAFRSHFTVHLDPLLWGSVYFQFSKFKEVQEGLMTFEHRDTSLYILREVGGYQLVSISARTRNLNLISHKKFDSIQRAIKAKILYSLGESGGGKIVTSTIDRGI
jgi:hypothetical protein